MTMIMSGKEYAARHGVSPSAVSLWIRRGKISGAALTGRHHIVVEEADRQIRERLDPFRGRPRAAEYPPQPSSTSPAAIAEAVARARQTWLAADAREWEEHLGYLEEFLSEILAELGRSDATDLVLGKFRLRF
jgi:hypothetical protein